MYSVTAVCVSLAFHSREIFVDFFLICIILFVLKMKKNKKEKRNSTPTSSNKNQINDC